MQVRYTTEGGTTEALLSSDSDWELFDRVADILVKEFNGCWVEKICGPDQAYWDVVIGEVKLTLHLEHYLGISLFPAKGYERNAVAKQLVREIGAYLEAAA